MGNQNAVCGDANALLAGGLRLTGYTRQRLLAMSFLKEGRDPVLTAITITNCDKRTAVRFADRVAQEGIRSAFHGNLGRRRYEQAYEMLKGVLADRRRGMYVRTDRFLAWLEREGVPAPSIRTVRYWLRHDFGQKRRRSHRRLAKRFVHRQSKGGSTNDGDR